MDPLNKNPKRKIQNFDINMQNRTFVKKKWNDITNSIWPISIRLPHFFQKLFARFLTYFPQIIKGPFLHRKTYLLKYWTPIPSVGQSISPSVRESFSPSVCQPVSPSIRQYVSTSVYQSISPSVMYMFIYQLWLELLSYIIIYFRHKVV